MKSFDLEIVIKSILEENEYARKDDMYLYYTYLEKKGCHLLNAFKSRAYRKEHNIATFQAVERCGRKIRQNNPALNVNADKRVEATKEFIKLAQNYNVEVW